MRRKEPCERCGTRRFKKKSDGTMVCKNGHVLLGWIEQTQEEEIVYTGRRRKRVKELQHAEHGDSRYKGIDRESAIVQVCQTGLNLLVEYCVREFGFPENIQRIAQSLWEIYVIGSEKLITFDIFDTGEEDDYFDDTQQQPQSITENALRTMPMPSRTLEDELGVDLDDDDAFDKEVQNQIDEEKEQHQQKNGKDNHDNNDNNKNANVDYGNGNGDDKESNADDDEDDDGVYEWPELRYAHIIIFLFLTFKWARLPVLFSDIRRWCQTLQLPYMDTLYQIPDRVVRRLDRATIYTLKYIPYISVLNKDLRRYQICFQKHCRLQFSNENVPGLLHRLYPHFGLPDTFRSHASVVLEKIQDSMVKHDKYFKSKDKDDDIQAVICMIMVMKIIYYLDDRPEGKKNRPLPAAPPKESVIKNIQSSINWCKNIKKKRSMSLNGENNQVNIAFLENLAKMLKIANITNNEGLTFEKEISSSVKHVNKQFDLIYLPSEQPQDLTSLDHLDLKKAKDQIRNSPSVYDVTFRKRKTAIYKPKMISKEYQTLLELAATLTDVDSDYLQIALTRFEYQLRNFIG